MENTVIILLIVISTTVIFLFISGTIGVIGALSPQRQRDKINRNCTGEWTKWSDCSKNCGTGTRYKSFNITQKALGNGYPCNYENGEKLTESCNTDPCVDTPCEGVWGNWSECSKECGGGIKNRKFNVTKTATGNVFCEAKDGDRQTQSCNTQPCPIDCVGELSDWDQCDKDCKGGRQSRTFTITQEAKYSGKECKVKAGSSESKSCNNDIKCCRKDQWYGIHTGDQPIYPKSNTTIYGGDLDILQRKISKNKDEMDDKKGIKECNQCTDCGIAGVKKPCSATSDTICNELCKPGKTWSHSGFAPCKEVTPCTVQGIAKVGTYNIDNICKSSCWEQENKWGIDSVYGPPCYDKCKDKQYSDTGFGPKCFECQTCDEDKTKVLCGHVNNTVCKPDSPITPKDGKCPEGYYEYIDKKCYKCQECEEGSKIYADCTSTSNTKCIKCGENKFYGKRYIDLRDFVNRYNPQKDNSNIARYEELTKMPTTYSNVEEGCLTCVDCKFAGVEKECTATSDTICKKPCVPGKTWSETGFAPCKPVVVDCSKKGGIEKAASYLNDNICKLK